MSLAPVPTVPDRDGRTVLDLYQFFESHLDWYDDLKLSRREYLAGVPALPPLYCGLVLTAKARWQREGRPAPANRCINVALFAALTCRGKLWIDGIRREPPDGDKGKGVCRGR